MLNQLAWVDPSEQQTNWRIRLKVVVSVFIIYSYFLIKHKPGAKTINVFRACLGAQLTICAQKLRNFVLFSTVSLRFVLSRVCIFLYSLGPRSLTVSTLCNSFLR